MGKIKSAICLTAITIVIAVLCIVCFVPFPTDSDGIHFFNPIINWTQKSTELGGYQYGGENAAYLGGGYTAVLYPEGILSKKDYEANLEGKETEEEKAEYAKEYLPHAGGAIYLERKVVCEGDTDTVSEEFGTNFENNVKVLKKRFEDLHESGTKVEVCDDYTVRVSLPTTMTAPAAALLYFSYLGDFTIRTGSSFEEADVAIPEARSDRPLEYYVSGTSVTTLNGVIYVVIHFTPEGGKIISNLTSGAASSAVTLYFGVGDMAVINLSVSDQIVENDLYISGSYTSETADIVATVIDSSIGAAALGQSTMDMELGGIYRIPAAADGNGSLSALNLLYICVGVLAAAAIVFFLVRYRRLGFASVYTFFAYLVLMVVIFWAVPIELSVGTVLAFVFGAILLLASNAVAYEYARKEYSVGKTIASSVKTGYRKCFWHIFDLHIALLIAALLIYLIAITELAAFALALTFAVLLSGLCTIVLNRFLWYIMMPLAKSGAKFCHFKREEVEDDE